MGISLERINITVTPMVFKYGAGGAPELFVKKRVVYGGHVSEVTTSYTLDYFVSFFDRIMMDMDRELYKLVGQVTNFGGYMDPLDPLFRWAKGRCNFGPKELEMATVVWDDYLNWCNDKGVKFLSKARFFSQVEKYFQAVKRIKYRNSRYWYFVGLSLINSL